MEVGLPCPASDQAPAHGLVLRPHQCFSPQPCQSSYCYCQEVLDRLIQCGLLVAEEVGRAVETKPRSGFWPPTPTRSAVGVGVPLAWQTGLGPASASLCLGLCPICPIMTALDNCTSRSFACLLPPPVLVHRTVALKGRCSLPLALQVGSAGTVVWCGSWCPLGLPRSAFTGFTSTCQVCRVSGLGKWGAQG